jgi:ABC-type glycerol-3-phosphate transport system substrate-binding protein
MIKNLNRRQFLQMSSLLAAGLAVPACGSPTTPEPQKATAVVESTPAGGAASEQVVLDVGVPQPEFYDALRKIWDKFEEQHPNTKINLFEVNEDQFAAYQAKIANGYVPAIEHTWSAAFEGINQYNYQNFVNIGEIDFPWFDRWEYDVEHAWADLYKQPGPRALDIFQGFIVTWMYHTDVMERSGLDPRRDVKTWDDLKKFLDEGTAWAKSDPDVDYFWDLAYHNFVLYVFYMDLIPMAFPDGGRDRQRDCWLGKAKFNDTDSPYRHSFEFFKEAQQKGWTPDGWWTRSWEKDMEASYMAKRSTMMLHGHWPWQKMLAVDPNAQQIGFPSTPPATGQDTWRQWVGQVQINWGYTMRDKVQELPEWKQIKEAFFWWHSPEAVAMQAQAEGRPIVYKLDEPLDLTAPQWMGVLKDIAPDGLWPDVEFSTGLTGETAAAPYLKEGATGVWDWANDGFYSIWRDFMTDKLTVQEALDVVQKRWEDSYEGLPEK